MHIEQSDFHDHLMRGLSHKMNNILSLFHGYLGLLMEDKKLDDETLNGLIRIREGAQEATALMARTRSLTKPSSTVWREILPHGFFRQLAPSLEAVCDCGIRLEIDCPEDLQPIWIDPSRLCSAITEIVRNACEASPPQGVVKIKAREEIHQGADRGDSSVAPPIVWFVLSIADEGEGIAREFSDKIFQPFFSTKRHAHAMGLGLSVAAGLVQQMGGLIRFESRPGKTVFRLLLPSRSEQSIPL